jgi:SAM-dependent methyltransferase
MIEPSSEGGDNTMDAETAHRAETDLFAEGDYSFWSRVFEPVSEALVEAAGVGVESRVLDVAAGNGNTSLAAARRGAFVTALDLSPSQIERGRSRARQEGRPVEWVRGRAERLPFAEGVFDLAFNSFGDEVAIDEMFRVLRAAGVVGIAGWTREGFDRSWGELEARLMDHPEEEGTHLWGREEEIRATLRPYSGSIDIRPFVLPAGFESVESFCSQLLTIDPYTRALHQRLSPDQWRRFSAELPRIAAEWNVADDGSLLLELRCMLTIARKG